MVLEEQKSLTSSSKFLRQTETVVWRYWRLLANRTGLHFLHDFVEFNPWGGCDEDEKALNGSVVLLLRVDLLLITEVTCLTEKTSLGHLEKLYTATCGWMLKLLLEQIIGNTEILASVCGILHYGQSSN